MRQECLAHEGQVGRIHGLGTNEARACLRLGVGLYGKIGCKYFCSFGDNNLCSTVLLRITFKW